MDTRRRTAYHVIERSGDLAAPGTIRDAMRQNRLTPEIKLAISAVITWRFRIACRASTNPKPTTVVGEDDE